jgi:hypothetical protein
LVVFARLDVEDDKESPKAIKDKLKKDMADSQNDVVKNLEIDAQKRVIFEIKSPFNFIFEPEFSTGSPVGEGRVDIVARLCMVVDWCIDHPEYTAKIKVIS